MSEEWRPCFDGYYEASNLGRVRRAKPFTRRTRSGRKAIYKPGGILKPHRRKRDGREHVTVCIDGKRLTRAVHQLVAEAFLGPCPPGHEVNHIDGVKTNNRAVNLEYATHAENCAHAVKNGLIRGRSRRGAENPRALLTADDVREIRRLKNRGWTLCRLAKRFGVSTSTIDAANRGVSWRHIA